MTNIRIICQACKWIFPHSGEVRDNQIKCPECGHIVFEPGRDRK